MNAKHFGMVPLTVCVVVYIFHIRDLIDKITIEFSAILSKYNHNECLIKTSPFELRKSINYLEKKRENYSIENFNSQARMRKHEEKFDLFFPSGNIFTYEIEFFWSSSLSHS